MGQLTIRGKFEATETQLSLLAKNGVKLYHEFISEKRENDKLTSAHWETHFEWNGTKPPLTQDDLCYDQGDDWVDKLPSALARKNVRRETMDHTTTGLGGTKD
ncbi:hypothetical protein [Floridanema evergladense]|uniref:Uncharacterized protein n=1 Tax=Floridaenema evergladense BLCC-F167 TaxID=3153639 RepID=A0ABV4WD08_9CYAN